LAQQVVLQSGTNQSNWLAPAGGEFRFTFTGSEAANPPDPTNPYRVAVLEVRTCSGRLNTCGGISSTLNRAFGP
jgi:hypothetical protein